VDCRTTIRKGIHRERAISRERVEAGGVIAEIAIIADQVVRANGAQTIASNLLMAPLAR
jgi:hypothetical protein